MVKETKNNCIRRSKTLNRLKNKIQEEIPEFNTLKVLLQSLKFQLGDLKNVNKNIDNLKSEKKGGLAKKKE